MSHDEGCRKCQREIERLRGQVELLEGEVRAADTKSGMDNVIDQHRSQMDAANAEIERLRAALDEELARQPGSYAKEIRDLTARADQAERELDEARRESVSKTYHPPDPLAAQALEACRALWDPDILADAAKTNRAIIECRNIGREASEREGRDAGR